MRVVLYRSLAVALATWIGLASRAIAGDGSCAHCGCHAECQKVCRLVCEEKNVAITCWGCKCEDFCVPGHSKPGCRNCELVCQSCDEKYDPHAPIARPKNFVWTEWIPGCAQVHTKKKLMKKTVTKKVPSYKCVVEDLCSQCEAKSASAEIPLGASVPPPPVVVAK